MTVIAANSPEIIDAMLDLETGLAVARLIYTHYFERTGESAQYHKGIFNGYCYVP